MKEESWFKVTCDCGCVNWIYFGDMEDETAQDVNGFICRSCGIKHNFFDDCNVKLLGEEEYMYEVGLETPI